MTRTLIASLAALALSAGLAAPAVSADPSERIRVVGVNGYSVIDRQHLILDGIGTRYYLVTLQRTCFDLRHGMHIATSFGSTATIFNPRFEYVITGGPGVSRIQQRCYIETIEQVDSRDAARALVEERREAAEEAEAEEVGDSR